MIAPVPVTADSPPAATATAALPAAIAAPAASFGDLLMQQLLGSQVATATPARSAFPPAPAANISATISLPAGGKISSAAPVVSSKVPASAPGEKKSAAPVGLAFAAANLFQMPVVAPQAPAVGNAWNAVGAQTNFVRSDEGSGDDLAVDSVTASPVSPAIPILSAIPATPSARSLVSDPVSDPLDSQISARPATSDEPAGKGLGKRNGEARQVIEVAGRGASADSPNGLRRGEAVAAPSANEAWPMPDSITTDAPVGLPRFTQNANQALESPGAGPLFAAAASDGDLNVQSSYRSWQPLPVISAASTMTAEGRQETPETPEAKAGFATVRGAVAAAPMIGSAAPAYAEQTAASSAVSGPVAVVPQGRGATALRSTTSFSAGLYSSAARVEAGATPATTSAAGSGPAFSAVQTTQPAIAGPDTSRPAAAAALPAMPPNEAISSWPMRTGSTAPTGTAQTSTAQTSRAGVGERPVPPLVGPDENFDSTYSANRENPAAPDIASGTQKPATAPANARLAMFQWPAPAAAPAMPRNEVLPALPVRSGSTTPTITAPTSTAGVGVRTVLPLRGSDENSHSTQDSVPLHPGRTATPTLRGSGFVFHTSPPNTKLSSDPDSATAVADPKQMDASDSAPGKVAAEVFPAMLNRAIPLPPASSSNSAQSDPAQEKVTAEVFPAKLNRTDAAPAASAANPTATASPFASVMVAGQPAPAPDAGAKTHPSVAAAPARPVASAPANFANPAPAKAEAVKPAAELDPIPASSEAAAGVTRPAATSSEFRAPASNPAASAPTSEGTNPAPLQALAPSAVSDQAASSAAPNAEEAEAADSGATIQADALATDPVLLNPVAPGNGNAPEKTAPGNILLKTSAESSAAAPAGVSRKAAAPQARPSPPDASGNSNQTQHQPSLTPADASASQGQDKAQTPGAASEHANQPSAASAAQAVPLAESRPSSPHSDAGINANQAPEASGNIPREAESVPTPVVVQSARVLERMGQTEMRVGMNTADFGNVELRTSVGQDRVGASIATAHAELRAAMMAEMPSLERSMEQHQLRLDHLDLGTNGGGSSSHERGASAQQQPRSQSGGEAGFAATSSFSSSSDAVPPPEGPAPSSWSAPYSSGLNVHA